MKYESIKCGHCCEDWHKNSEMTEEEKILETALRWYIGMYGCKVQKVRYDDGYIEYSNNGYVTDREEALAIAKARSLIDFWE